MMLEIDLQKLLGAVNVPADWVGIREVYEAHTPRMIRDGVPVANSRSSTHGLMVSSSSSSEPARITKSSA